MRLREGKDSLIPSPQMAEAGHESLGFTVAGRFVPERAVAMNLGAGQFRASKIGAGASSPSPSLSGANVGYGGSSQMADTSN